jgi:stage V sporulation protein AF
LRILVFLAAPLIPALWVLALGMGEALPPALAFLVPKDTGALPILLQLYLAEFAIDALKLASMNAPSLLSNSLSVIGGLILGDFAVEVGWFCPDVIFYMAVVAVAGFAQRSPELTYAMKFVRMALLALSALFGWAGFALGLLLFPLFLSTNATVLPHRYLRLRPLLPRRPKKNA